MSTSVTFNRIEIGTGAPFLLEQYRVTFTLDDNQNNSPAGTLTDLGAVDVAGSLTVSMLVQGTTEAEVFAKSRRKLHEALSRLADATKPTV